MLNARPGAEVRSVGAKRFEIPQSSSSGAIFGTAVFFVLAVGTLWILFRDDSSSTSTPQLKAIIVICDIFFWGLVWQSIGSILAAKPSSIFVDDEGIWAEQTSPTMTHIKWTDIQTIQERPMRAALVLIGKDGKTLLNISYYVERRDELASLIASRLAPPQPADLPVNFYTKPINYGLGVAILFGSTLVFLYALQQGAIALSFLSVTIALIVGWQVKGMLFSISVSKDSINLQYLFLKATLNFSDIDDIRLAFLADGKIERLVVSVTLGNGNTIVLSPISNPVALYQLLRSRRQVLSFA